MDPDKLRARTESIRERLAKFSQYPEQAFCGLPTGHFLLGPPLRDDQVVTWERRFGVRLPEDYRSFICRVGNGSLTMGSGIRDLLSLQVPLASSLGATPFPHTVSWNPILKCDPKLSSAEERKAIETDYFDDCHIAGTIEVLHDTSIPVILVVCGAEKGYLWCDERPFDGGIYPMGGSWGSDGEDPGERITFLDYYDRNLDSLLAEAARYLHRTQGR